MSMDAVPDAALLAALRLSMTPGVGPRTQQSLLDYFGSCEAVWKATRAELLQVDGVGPKLAAAILAAPESREAEAEYAECRELGVNLIVRGSDAYPPLLEKIPDPPAVLYVQGTFEPRDQLALAIVGSRQCTMYGRQQAEKLAAGLSRAGLTIVSGLARGIDGSAHIGALNAGGRTLAVLGTGVANIYPPEHKSLAQRVIAQGALISESPLHQAPLAGLFPQRNRIISGLCLGVLVVEAARNSGALHTVRHASEQNRDVFAVPGRIDSPASQGCHDLIRDGVALVRGVDDVLEALGPLFKPVAVSSEETLRDARELTLSDQERTILNLIPADPLQIDDVIQRAGIEPSRTLNTLTALEIKRHIRRLPGNQVCRR